MFVLFLISISRPTTGPPYPASPTRRGEDSESTSSTSQDEAGHQREVKAFGLLMMD